MKKGNMGSLGVGVITIFKWVVKEDLTDKGIFEGGKGKNEGVNLYTSWAEPYREEEKRVQG